MDGSGDEGGEGVGDEGGEASSEGDFAMTKSRVGHPDLKERCWALDRL